MLTVEKRLDRMDSKQLVGVAEALGTQRARLEGRRATLSFLMFDVPSLKEEFVKVQHRLTVQGSLAEKIQQVPLNRMHAIAAEAEVLRGRQNV